MSEVKERSVDYMPIDTVFERISEVVGGAAESAERFQDVLSGLVNDQGSVSAGLSRDLQSLDLLTQMLRCIEQYTDGLADAATPEMVLPITEAINRVFLHEVAARLRGEDELTGPNPDRDEYVIF